MQAQGGPETSVMSGVWRRDGEIWTVGLDGRATSLRDSKGLQHLSRLLERPGEPIRALDLVVASEGHGGGTSAAAEPELSVGELGDAGAVLDGQARAEYRRRLDEAREEAEEAERFNDPERAARARLEVEFLARELAGAVGLGGRERRVGSAAERARVNVTRSIRNAIDRIAAHDQPLADHLRLTVRTGTYCAYAPPPNLAVEWAFTAHERPLGAAAARAPIGDNGASPPAALRRPLLERDAELDRIDSALRDVVGGTGALLVLHGPAGIGKSSLVAATAERAASLGFTLAQARGGPFERAFAFGVCRQLFDPLLASLGDAQLAELRRGAARPAAAMLGYVEHADRAGHTSVAETASPDPFPIINGLYWLAARLCDQAPLALIVDDAHDADEATLAWLRFLAGRLRAHPMLLVMASREPTARSPEGLEPLLHAATGERLEVAPLSEEGVATLVRATWPDATGEFCHGCFAATGGNPFYLTQLMASAKASGVTPDGAGAARLRDITPETVTRLVLGRLNALSAEARALAEACAILEGADLALTAEVAEVSDQAALEAVDALVAAGIVEPSWPLRFSHPLIASAVARNTGLGARTRLRERAAALLAERNAPATEVAAHLLHARPSNNLAWVECLRAAARVAAAHATPETAAQLLERALAEPPPAEMVPFILLELGRACRDAGDGARAVAHLERAIMLTADPCLRAELVLELSAHDAWAIPARVAMVDDALAQVDEEHRQLRFSLESRAIELLNEGASQSASPQARQAHDERLGRIVAQATGETAAERQLLAIYAGDRAVRAAITADEAKALAIRALDDGVLMHQLAEGVWNCDAAIEVLTMVDAFDVADRHARQAERRAREHGAVAAVGYVSMLRAIIAWHRGALLEAEALLDSVFAIWRETSDPYVGYVAQQVQACVSIELGDLEAAERACAAIAAEGFAPMGAPHLRGRLFAARGQHDLAVPELRAAFELHRAVGRWRSVVMGSPRQDLALALAAVGNVEDALTLARAEHADARQFGAPSSVAAALRALGHAAGDLGIRHFHAAADLLAGSQAALARAQALVDLGAAQRLGGDLIAARGTLRQALELCGHIGARRLAERVRAELGAAGGREARVNPRAAELLSPAERRAATLAAEGASELDIAQALFLTVPGAAAQLSSALSKLELESTDDLADVMLQAD